MTDERDDLDRALAAGLADLAPAEPDAASTLATRAPPGSSTSRANSARIA